MPTEEQTYREGVKKDLAEIKSDQQEIKALVGYTNGKVKKIIIALVLLTGIVIGQNTTNMHDVAKLFFSTLGA